MFSNNENNHGLRLHDVLKRLSLPNYVTTSQWFYVVGTTFVGYNIGESLFPLSVAIALAIVTFMSLTIHVKSKQGPLFVFSTSNLWQQAFPSANHEIMKLSQRCKKDLEENHKFVLNTPEGAMVFTTDGDYHTDEANTVVIHGDDDEEVVDKYLKIYQKPNIFKINGVKSSCPK